ncbi:hypothetical protein TNCV_3982311 [Trichonephila clavipes]|nr:hypothetical protein TNCV_3982311 [Trichonephila clavipes]
MMESSTRNIKKKIEKQPGYFSTRRKRYTVCTQKNPTTEERASSQLSAKQKTLKTHHPDEEHKPRLPDSIAQPITNMPLSRMENTTFAMPSIIDSHDIGLRTVYSPDAQKKTPIQRLEKRIWRW